MRTIVPLRTFRSRRPAGSKFLAISLPKLAATDVALAVTYVIAATFVANAYVLGAQEFPAASSGNLISFTAPRPWQYRILVPVIGHVLCPAFNIAPGVFCDTVARICLIAIPFCFRSLLRRFIDDTQARLAAPAILLPIYIHYCTHADLNSFYVYDMPAILLTIVGLTYLFDGNWGAFRWVFLLAALNRETSIYLLVAAVLIQARQTPVFEIAKLLGLWSIVRATVVVAFHNNPGTPIQWQYEHNFLLTLAAIFDRTGPLPSRFAWFAGGLWIFLLQPLGRIPDRVLRLRWLVPLFLGGMFFVGVIDEMRIYNELLPVIALIAVLSCTATGDAGSASGGDGRRPDEDCRSEATETVQASRN